MGSRALDSGVAGWLEFDDTTAENDDAWRSNRSFWDLAERPFEAMVDRPEPLDDPIQVEPDPRACESWLQHEREGRPAADLALRGPGAPVWSGERDFSDSRYKPSVDGDVALMENYVREGITVRTLELVNHDNPTDAFRQSNCCECARATVLLFAGRPVAAARLNPMVRDLARPEDFAGEHLVPTSSWAADLAGRPSRLEGFARYLEDGGDPGEFEARVSLEALSRGLEAAGDGSAAIVVLDRKDGSGHALAAANIQGRCVLIDVQNPLGEIVADLNTATIDRLCGSVAAVGFDVFTRYELTRR